ncbi:MAG: A/G-specific adenine glycosylase [Ignavibacteriae bacterium]|nr:A/G-specific adenine glycosylase [Ignavibacteriota bacterium]
MRKNSTPKLSRDKRGKFITTLLIWYTRHGRTLPWRNITNPYRILVSEIMLQQTQVSRVLVKHPTFLKRFPTMTSLANARRRDVVIAWQGMGYNNRAVRLHQLAGKIADQYRGKIPQTFEELVALPGIGKYTANALLSSVFGKDVPVVDVNVRRLLSRLFWKMRSTAETRSEGEIWQLATALLPKGRAYRWNQALMDIGATICTARQPRCTNCPASRFCRSRTSMRRERPSRIYRESSLGRIPNRIYRGRIVERLRERKGARSIKLTELGRRIYPGFSARNERWLQGIVTGLERDGLIVVRGNGSFNSRRVSLA